MDGAGVVCVALRAAHEGLLGAGGGQGEGCDGGGEAGYCCLRGVHAFVGQTVGFVKGG